MRKIVYEMIILLVVSVFPSAFNVQLAKAVGATIYIRADGSVDPPSAPILNFASVCYTFTADISDSIVIERDNIVVDGAGHVLEGTGTGAGIGLSGRSNVTIKSVIIRKFGYGIFLSSSSGNTLYANRITTSTYDGIYAFYSSGNSISANTITNSTQVGIWLYDSSGNSISANTITNNVNGIYFYYSYNNSISANTITNNNYYGIRLDSSSGNFVCHNNFVGNTIQVETTPGYLNVWDDGYPSGGNYWSDYTGVDLYKGPYQNVPGTDKIGDTPYTINADSIDHYPLVTSWVPVTDVASLVVRGQNNLIYYRTYNVTTDSWTGWNALPGATCDSPAATVIGDELHIVVRGMDGNTLWHVYGNLTDNTFSGWTLLSSSTPSTPTLASNGTALSLVVRGQNNLIWYRFYDCASHTWADWAALPSGATCDGPAATMLGNKLHIVVRGLDGYNIWYSNVDLSTGVFSGWQFVGGATESKPTLTTCESRNEIILVVRGLNNVIYRNTWSSSSWTGWVGLPTGSTCDGVGATVIEEDLHIVVRGMDGYTLWHANVNLETGTFLGWASLSGSTPSKPTLAG